MNKFSAKDPWRSVARSLVPAAGRQRIFLIGAITVFCILAIFPYFDPPTDPPDSWRIELQHGMLAELAANAPDHFAIDIFRLKDKEPWMARVIRPVVLRAGKHYRLRFEARADRARPLAARLRNGQSPWNPIGAPIEYALGEDWRTYSLAATAPFDTFDARIEITLGHEVGRVEVRNLELIDE